MSMNINMIIGPELVRPGVYCTTKKHNKTQSSIRVTIEITKSIQQQLTFIYGSTYDLINHV